jgi:hypothetical protein
MAHVEKADAAGAGRRTCSLRIPPPGHDVSAGAAVQLHAARFIALPAVNTGAELPRLIKSSSTHASSEESGARPAAGALRRLRARQAARIPCIRSAIVGSVGARKGFLADAVQRESGEREPHGRRPFNLSCPRNGKRTRASGSQPVYTTHWVPCAPGKGSTDSLRQPGYRPTRWHAGRAVCREVCACGEAGAHDHLGSFVHVFSCFQARPGPNLRASSSWGQHGPGRLPDNHLL